MGAWGGGLYQDDDALDLKNSISLLSKMPVDGDTLLEILLKNRGGDGVKLSDDGGPTFWLVVADRFERGGIASKKVFDMALEAIDTGADLRDQRDRGMDEPTLKKRARMLTELGERLRNPRPLRPRKKRGKPPAFVVNVGDVYAFPTMSGKAVNSWFATWEQAHFTPDGWGAFVVVDRGRAYDWFPWCAVGSITVPLERKATIDDARRARFYDLGPIHLGVPRASQLKRMKAELIGTLPIDQAKGAQLARDLKKKHPDMPTPEYTVYAGWALSSMAHQVRDGEAGMRVSELFSS